MHTCTASNRPHALSIKRSYEPQCKLQVAGYLCSTNVHCVDGEPICANNDPQEKQSIYMVRIKMSLTEKAFSEWLLLWQLQFFFNVYAN